MQTFSRLIETFDRVVPVPVSPVPVNEAADTPYPLRWIEHYGSRYNVVSSGYYRAKFVGADDIEFIAWANETSRKTQMSDERYQDGWGREWQIGFRISDHSISELEHKYPDKNIRAYAITGLGDAFRVMATAVDFLKHVIAEERPVLITFTAESNEPSRQSLYARMLRRVSAQIPGYQGQESMSDPGHYMIFRGE